MRCLSVDELLHQGLKDPSHRILETHGSGFLSEPPAVAGGWLSERAGGRFKSKQLNHPLPQVVLTVLLLLLLSILEH